MSQFITNCGNWFHTFLGNEHLIRVCMSSSIWNLQWTHDVPLNKPHLWRFFLVGRIFWAVLLRNIRILGWTGSLWIPFQSLISWLLFDGSWGVVLCLVNPIWINYSLIGQWCVVPNSLVLILWWIKGNL